MKKKLHDKLVLACVVFALLIGAWALNQIVTLMQDVAVLQVKIELMQRPRP